MNDHVAVLRVLQELGEITPQEHAAITHAIATCEQHAALVARLGELEERWRLLAGNTVGGHLERILAGTRNYTANDCADDLARVVKGGGDGR